MRSGGCEVEGECEVRGCGVWDSGSMNAVENSVCTNEKARR